MNTECLMGETAAGQLPLQTFSYEQFNILGLTYCLLNVASCKVIHR